METIDAATETPPPGENGFYQTRPPKTEVFERKKKRRFGKWKKIKRIKNNVFGIFFGTISSNEKKI